MTLPNLCKSRPLATVICSDISTRVLFPPLEVQCALKVVKKWSINKINQIFKVPFLFLFFSFKSIITFNLKWLGKTIILVLSP